MHGAVEQEKTRRKGGLLLVDLDVKQTKDVLAYKHEYKVNQPDNPATEEDTDDCRYNLAFRKTRDNAANPRSDGDYRQNNADNVGKSKVIAFCHGSNSFLYLYFHYTMYMLLCQVYFKIFHIQT